MGSPHLKTKTNSLLTESVLDGLRNTFYSQLGYHRVYGGHFGTTFTCERKYLVSIKEGSLVKTSNGC